MKMKSLLAGAFMLVAAYLSPALFADCGYQQYGYGSGCGCPQQYNQCDCPQQQCKQLQCGQQCCGYQPGPGCNWTPWRNKCTNCPSPRDINYYTDADQFKMGRGYSQQMQYQQRQDMYQQPAGGYSYAQRYGFDQQQTAPQSQMPQQDRQTMYQQSSQYQMPQQQSQGGYSLFRRDEAPQPQYTQQQQGYQMQQGYAPQDQGQMYKYQCPQPQINREYATENPCWHESWQ